MDPSLLDGIIALHTVGYEGDLYLLPLSCIAEPQGCDSALRQIKDPGYLEWFPALSPDGTHLAYVSGRAQGSGEGLYLLELSTLSVARLTLQPGWFRDLTWSPNGQTLAFSYQSEETAPWAIGTIALEGGGLYTLPQIREHLSQPTWSPDGESIAFLGTDDWPAEPYSNLYVSNTDGTDVRQLGLGKPSFFGPARWSPDGAQLLTSIWPQPDLVLLDVHDSHLTYLTRSEAEEDAPYWSPDGQWLAYSNYDQGLYYIRVRDLAGYIDYLLAGPFTEWAGPLWSPDGAFLAFDAPAGEWRQGFIAAPDGAWVIQITHADLPLSVGSIWTP